MITIDVIDELETKTERPMNPKTRMIDKIWWGIWNHNNQLAQSRQQKMIDLAQIMRLDESNIGKWRVR